MTDARPMPQDVDRAERAMRAALRAHADDMTVVPLDPMPSAAGGLRAMTQARGSPVVASSGWPLPQWP